MDKYCTLSRGQWHWLENGPYQKWSRSTQQYQMKIKNTELGNIFDKFIVQTCHEQMQLILRFKMYNFLQLDKFT